MPLKFPDLKSLDPATKDAALARSKELRAEAQVQAFMNWYSNDKNFTFKGDKDRAYALSDFINRLDEKILFADDESLREEAKKEKEQALQGIFADKKFEFDGQNYEFAITEADQHGIAEIARNNNQAEVMFDSTNDSHALLITANDVYLYALKSYEGDNGAAHTAYKIDDSTDKPEKVMLKMQIGRVAKTLEAALKGSEVEFIPAPPENVQKEHAIASLYHPVSEGPALGRGLVKISSDAYQSAEVGEKLLRHMLTKQSYEAAEAHGLLPWQASSLQNLVQGDVNIQIQTFVEGESLNDFLEQNPGLSEKQKIDLAIKIIDAILNFHKQTKAYHCDIRPENIKVYDAGDGNLIVAMIDPGAANYLQDGIAKKVVVGSTDGYTHAEIIAMAKKLDETYKQEMEELGFKDEGGEKELPAVELDYEDKHETYPLLQILYNNIGLTSIPGVGQFDEEMTLDKLREKLIRARAVLESSGVKAKSSKARGGKVAAQVRRIEGDIDTELGRPPSPRRPPSPPPIATGTITSPGWEKKPGGGWIRKGGKS